MNINHQFKQQSEYCTLNSALFFTQTVLSSLSQERAQLVQEKDLMSRKLQSLMADYECEKKEKFDIKVCIYIIIIHM